MRIHGSCAALVLDYAIHAVIHAVQRSYLHCEQGAPETLSASGVR